MSKMRRRQKAKKHIGSVAILGVVLFLFVVVLGGTLNLRAENKQKEVYIAQLEEWIVEENEHAEEIKEYKIFVKTKEFVEKVAKELLGLVNEGEIIFKAED